MRIRNRKGKWIELPDDDGLVCYNGWIMRPEAASDCAARNIAHLDRLNEAGITLEQLQKHYGL